MAGIGRSESLLVSHVSKSMFPDVAAQLLIIPKTKLAEIHLKYNSTDFFTLALMAKSDVHSTGDLEVTGSIPARSDNVLS